MSSALHASELDQKKREIFVRNLSYDTTADELIELFQEIGPIKRGSITQKDGVSRGFGFIKFALEEDASSAIAQMNGREFKGRKLIIETAVNKGQNPLTVPVAEGADGIAPAPVKGQKASRVSASADAPKLTDIGDAKERKLQLVVFGVTAAVGKKAFRKYLKSISKKATVHVITADHPLAAWIEDTSHDFSTSASASIYKPLIVTAPNAIECKKIQDTINTPGSSGIIQRKLLEYSQQDGEEGDEGSGGEVEGTAGPSGAVISARSVNHITEPRLRKRKCRLILRNLSFQATESNISSKLMTFGPLTEVSIARVPVSGDSRRHRKGGDDQPQEPKLKSRGFAFVTFLCESDAKRAVEGSSALRICNREFALDFCTAKDKQATAAEEEAAVHSSVDKDTNMDAADTESESDIGEEESGSDAGGHEMSGSEDASPEDMDGEDSDGESAAEEPIPIEPDKPAKPADVGEGKTVFVRDLPFDATASDVRRAFRPFGAIVMCLLVTDKETGLSKGSAFVKFEDASAAEAAVLAGSYSMGGMSGATARGPVYVSGKPTRIDMAVDRDQARRLEDGKDKRGRADGGKDRRNLYLSNEGLGVGSALLEADMPDADKDKRKRAHNEKRKKLQNPLFFVSATRLCVRNLKKAVSDNEFKDLCIKATKEGLQRALVSPDDMDIQLAARGLSIRERPAEALVVPSLQAPCLGGKSSYQKFIKAKIMRDTTRMNAGTTDTAQSRGYGFVEFQHHGHALACLRQLNNNPEYCEHSMSHANQDPSKRPRLIVEFSLEDSRKVNMLKKRNEKGKQLQIAEKLSEINTDSDKKVPKKNPKISKRSANVNVADSADEKSQKVAKPLSSPSVAAVSMAESSSNDVGKNSEKINNKRANREALKKSRDNKIKKKKKL